MQQWGKSLWQGRQRSVKLDKGENPRTYAGCLGLESSSSRMSALGRGRLLYGRILEVQDVLDAIKAVRREDVLRVAQQVLTSRNMSAALVGPVERPEAIRARIQGK